MATLALLTAACQNNQKQDKTPITKPEITIEGGRLTPEALWAMGRINSVHPDEQSGRIAYTISYYNVEENRSTSWIRMCKERSKQLEVFDEFVGNSFTFMHWRRKWQPTPVFLPGESQGQGSLVGCSLWDCRVRHD